VKPRPGDACVETEARGLRAQCRHGRAGTDQDDPKVDTSCRQLRRGVEELVVAFVRIEPAGADDDARRFFGWVPAARPAACRDAAR